MKRYEVKLQERWAVKVDAVHEGLAKNKAYHEYLKIDASMRQIIFDQMTSIKELTVREGE